MKNKLALSVAVVVWPAPILCITSRVITRCVGVGGAERSRIPALPMKAMTSEARGRYPNELVRSYNDCILVSIAPQALSV